MAPLSTEEVAKQVGIARSTLELWIQQGRVNPKVVAVGRRNYRLWSTKEIAKVRQVKQKTYRKGRGRKKQKD